MKHYPACPQTKARSMRRKLLRPRSKSPLPLSALCKALVSSATASCARRSRPLLTAGGQSAMLSPLLISVGRCLNSPEKLELNFFYSTNPVQSARSGDKQGRERTRDKCKEDAPGNCAGGVHGAFVRGHVQFCARQLSVEEQQNWTVQARVSWKAQAVSSCAMLCAAGGGVLWA